MAVTTYDLGSVIGPPGAQGSRGATGATGATGSVPTIGGNGNWYRDGIDTGVLGDASKAVGNKLVNNVATTTPGFALDARQGKNLQDQVNTLNSKLNEVNKIVFATNTVCAYLTGNVLQNGIAQAIHGISDLYDNRNNYMVLLTIRQQDGTPYNQVTELTYEIRQGNMFVVNALGNFINGHLLAVSVMIIKR